jgi:hypothetical protein
MMIHGTSAMAEVADVCNSPTALIGNTTLLTVGWPCQEMVFNIELAALSWGV